MNEENNEMVDLLKELVTRIKKIENTVYNSDNILRKSGIVTVDSPAPKVGQGGTIPDSDTIAKMSWDQINDLVDKMGGNV